MEQQAGDKEVQPAPEVEVIVGDQPENQPVEAKQTENVGMPEMIRLMMEINKKIDDSNKELKEDNQKNIGTLKEEFSKKIEDTNKSTKEEDVYKRQYTLLFDRP